MSYNRKGSLARRYTSRDLVVFDTPSASGGFSEEAREARPP